MKLDNQTVRAGQPVRLLLALTLLAFLVILASLLSARILNPFTRLELVDLASGRVIYSSLLPEGQQVTLTWTNSIFRQNFREVFVARAGSLVLVEVTVTDPDAPYVMEAQPADLDDLYHVGGAFHVSGVERPFTEVIYRISEIGDPHLSVGGTVIAFKEEVGFGGRIRLRTQPVRWYENLIP